jgi:hypothetical protein
MEVEGINSIRAKRGRETTAVSRLAEPPASTGHCANHARAKMAWLAGAATQFPYHKLLDVLTTPYLAKVQKRWA